MKKKWLALALSLTMAVGCMTGCGEKSKTNSEKSNTLGSAEVKELEDGGGKVLNIYVWNDEFINRFEQYYPGYDKETKKIGDVKVKFVQSENEGSEYQKKLEEALMNQEGADEDSKVDMFLCEMDYVSKYTGTDMAVDVKSLGLTDEDMSQMYAYTKEVATDEDGVLRAVSWQGCPGGFVYRRSYAKEIFGTDEPEKIQELLRDWEKFDAAAATVKEKSGGTITMLSGYDDALRVFFNNAGSKLVSKDKKIQLDASVEKWIDKTKEYTDNGYNQKTSLWTEEWTDGMGENGNVFGYFMPVQGIHFWMPDKSGSSKDAEGKYVGDGSYGDWAVVTGPQSFNWGGSFVCGAKGTDNAALVKDIMLKLCCDSEILYHISKEQQDFVNNKEANAKLEADGVVSDFLGGQSLVKVLSEVADNIDGNNVSPYDQGCIENLRIAMKDYYEGKVDKETAIGKWKDLVIRQYPTLSK